MPSLAIPLDKTSEPNVHLKARLHATVCTTLPGLLAKIAAKLLALTAGIWHNWKAAAPHKRSLIAYDHSNQ